MTTLEKIARESRENARLAAAAAQQLRACQVRQGKLRDLADAELERLDRRRAARPRRAK